MQQTNELLERIATALETIAEALTRKPEPSKPRQITGEVSESSMAGHYLAALLANDHRLNGRLTVEQIASICGVEVTRNTQAEMGRALTAFGAGKQKSGSVRYYHFS